MPNLEKFANNTTFLRIIWKEVHNLTSSFKKGQSSRKIKMDKTKTRKKDKLRVDVSLSHGKASEVTPKGEELSLTSSPEPKSLASPGGRIGA